MVPVGLWGWVTLISRVCHLAPAPPLLHVEPPAIVEAEVDHVDVGADRPRRLEVRGVVRADDDGVVARLEQRGGDAEQGGGRTGGDQHVVGRDRRRRRPPPPRAASDRRGGRRSRGARSSRSTSSPRSRSRRSDDRALGEVVGDRVVAELLGRLDLDRHPAVAHRRSMPSAVPRLARWWIPPASRPRPMCSTSAGTRTSDRPDERARRGRDRALVAIQRLQAAYADAVTRRRLGRRARRSSSPTPLSTSTPAPRAAVHPRRADGAHRLHRAGRGAASVLRVHDPERHRRPRRDAATGPLYICELRHAGDGSWSQAYGLYRDRYRRRDGAWRIAGRRYSSLARPGRGRHRRRSRRALAPDGGCGVHRSGQLT